MLELEGNLEINSFYNKESLNTASLTDGYPVFPCLNTSTVLLNRCYVRKPPWIFNPNMFLAIPISADLLKYSEISLKKFFFNLLEIREISEWSLNL